LSTVKSITINLVGIRLKSTKSLEKAPENANEHIKVMAEEAKEERELNKSN
jgi:predicted RNase H-like HicB family nuclease